MSDLSQQAIVTALSQDWKQAISFNEAIIKESSQDLDALSRLAYAYTQIGNIETAKKLYKRILSIDKYNFIAKKNLDRIASLPKNQNHQIKGTKHQVSPKLFIEEPGKTKTITLTHVAPVTTLAHVGIGQMVVLYPRKHSIEVRDTNKTYLGAMPDDVSFRLLRLLAAGNIYQACVKNVQKNTISIFIRELKRGKRFVNVPSFPTHEPIPLQQKSKKRTISEKKEKPQPEKSDDFDV